MLVQKIPRIGPKLSRKEDAAIIWKKELWVGQLGVSDSVLCDVRISVNASLRRSLWREVKHAMLKGMQLNVPVPDPDPEARIMEKVGEGRKEKSKKEGECENGND